MVHLQKVLMVLQMVLMLLQMVLMLLLALPPVGRGTTSTA